MKYAIELELELEQIEDATGIRFDLEDVADDFWSELVRITRRYVKGRGAAKRVISNYFIECSGDYYCSDNTITLIFPDSGGLCSLSSLLSLHWAELVLSINEKGFRKFFKQMKWNLKTKFAPVAEIREETKHFYFESKQRVYAISKSREGEPYLVYDAGEELCQLPALEELDLYENSIVELPPNIGQLTNLKLLRLGRSEKAERGLTALPDSIKNIPETRLITSEEGLDNLKKLAAELSLSNPVFAR